MKTIIITAIAFVVMSFQLMAQKSETTSPVKTPKEKICVKKSKEQDTRMIVQNKATVKGPVSKKGTRGFGPIIRWVPDPTPSTLKK